MPQSANQPYQAVLNRARQITATYGPAEVDEAIRPDKPLEAFLAQG